MSAVENTAAPGNSTGTGGSTATGKQFGPQQSRPLVMRMGQGSLWAFKCIPPIARASVIVRETAGVTDPRRLVRTGMHAVANDHEPTIPTSKSLKTSRSIFPESA